MAQEITKNPDAVVGDFSKKDPNRPFELKDALFTIGNQWKQRYITKIGDEYYILPAQYNIETGEGIFAWMRLGWGSTPWTSSASYPTCPPWIRN